MSDHELKAAAEHLASLMVMCEADDAIALEAVSDALKLTAQLPGVEPTLVEQLMHAADLAVRISTRQTPDPVGLYAILQAAVDDIRVELSGTTPTASSSLEQDESLIAEFISRALEHLQDADECLLRLERDGGDRDSIDAAFRSFHTIKGMTGFLSLTSIGQLAHEGEALLELARKPGGHLDAESLDAAFRAVDRLRGAVSALAREGDDEGAESMNRPTEGCLGQRQRPMSETVRVDAARLGQLLDAVGELVIAESMASRTARVEASASAELNQQLGRLDKLTRQLHEMAGSLRMVPLRPTFQRLARAVRDVSHRAGKPVDLVMSGQETELDRAVVDRIEDPLLHLVRNAVDHGIEVDADERRRAGKSEVGRIEIRAYHKAGSIYVEVEDDGRGLDRDSIIAKAEELGLVSPGQQCTDREILGLMFTPGLSTSELVTDVSGRGVGMDVVKRTVDALAGQIAVRSEPGRGTTFIIRLPITLAVIDGMAIRVGLERYIVPTLSVVRSVRPEAEEIASVFGNGEVLQHGDELLRLVRLSNLFSLESDGRVLTDSIVMVVENDGQRAGLVIDEILGQQQIVIKSLGEGLGEVTGVSGGAVMPDGRVGLILDVEGLVSLANAN